MMVFGLPAAGIGLERQTPFAGTGLSFDALLNQNATTASQLTEQRALGFQEVGMMGLAQATQSASLAVSEPADVTTSISRLAMNAAASQSDAHLNNPMALASAMNPMQPTPSTQLTANAGPQRTSDEIVASASVPDLTATTGAASEAAAWFEIGASPATAGDLASSMAYAEMVSTHRETAAGQKAPVLASLEMAAPDAVNSDFEPGDTSAGSTTPAKVRDAAQDQADRGALRVEISNSDDGLTVAVMAPGITPDSSGPLRRRVLDMVTAHKLMLAGVSINGSSSMTYSTANEGGQNGR
jgi:hypothetical protein